MSILMIELIIFYENGPKYVDLIITIFIRESYGLKEAGLLTYTYPKDRSKQMMSKVKIMRFEIMRDHKREREYHNNQTSTFDNTLITE